MRAVTRRAVMAGTATAGVAAALTFSAGSKAPVLAIYDSRLPEARLFAEQARGRGIALHDIADEDTNLWRASRAIAHAPGRAVIGMTGWTDWVALRGLFAGQGLRVQQEARRRSPPHATATTFEWALA
ncbi:MAG TPA: hypothetical protein VK980_12615 [Sphingomonas sp.]|nr:hypothetical protein [Sphingomonas sp.]